MSASVSRSTAMPDISMGTRRGLKRQGCYFGRRLEKIHVRFDSNPTHQTKFSLQLGEYIPLTNTGTISDYKSHQKEVFIDTKEVGNLQDILEFKKATKLCSFKACNDDGLANFLHVWFLHAPLSWNNCKLEIPLYPICMVGDFEPYGLEVNNRTLVKEPPQQSM